MNNRTFAFQFATMAGKIIKDESLLTFKEVAKLWEEYYPEAAKLIKGGQPVQMYIWMDMKKESDYHTTMVLIDNDYESDGNLIYPPNPMPVPKKLTPPNNYKLPGHDETMENLEKVKL